MAEDQDMTEHGRAEGNGADQQQNPPHVVHAGATPPNVLHAGGEGQDRHGHEGEQQRGGHGQQQQRAADQSQEAASRVIRAGARATDQAGQAARSGARVAESATSAFGTVTQATVGTSARLMQDGMQAPLQVADIKALSQSLDGMVQTGLVLARGSQQALTQWVDYGRQATDRNVRALNDLGRIRSMKDLVTWQTELMKDNIEDWLHSSIQLYELSAQAAKEAVDKMRESGMLAAQSAQSAQLRGQA